MEIGLEWAILDPDKEDLKWGFVVCNCPQQDAAGQWLIQ